MHAPPCCLVSSGQRGGELFLRIIKSPRLAERPRGGANDDGLNTRAVEFVVGGVRDAAQEARECAGDPVVVEINYLINESLLFHPC
jgi:hypothetical protein